jgi:phage terminase large subunit
MTTTTGRTDHDVNFYHSDEFERSHGFEREERQERGVPLRLHPRQHAFVTSPARFAFYVGGVGAGKSFAGAARSIIWMWEHPGSLGLIGAPTYPMLRDATQRTFFELLPRELIRRFSKTEQHLVLINGSEILFRSLDDADRTRGLNLGWFWLDEAPLCGYYAWTVLKARLRQAGQATAAWATGTPHGRDGYARDFELAIKPDHQLYRASTRENQANLPESFIADLGYSGQFALQEIEGLFVAFDGLVYEFDTTSPKPIAHTRSWDGERLPGRIVGGVDWGYTNPAVALVGGVDGDERLWVLDEWAKRRASLEGEIIPAIVGLTRQYGVTLWYCDAEDPEAIAKLDAQLVSLGLACRAVAVKKGPGSVRAGIQTVTRLLALRGDGTRGLYVSPRCALTIAEMGQYSYMTANERRRDPSEEPIAQNNHALDALRYIAHSELGQATTTDAYLDDLQRALERMEAEARALRVSRDGVREGNGRGG